MDSPMTKSKPPPATISERQTKTAVNEIQALAKTYSAGRKVPRSRNRRPKMRKDAKKHASRLLEIARAAGVGGMVDLDQLEGDLAFADRIRTVVAALEHTKWLLEGVAMDAESDAWIAFTTTYALLARKAKTTARIADQLADLRAVFARQGRKGPRKGKAKAQ